MALAFLAQKHVKIAHPSFEKLLTLSDLSKLHWQLLWIYDEPLGRSGRSGHYWNYPTAAWLIRRGTVRLRFGKDTETYHAGQWVFPRLAEGTQSFSKDAEILSVRFQLINISSRWQIACVKINSMITSFK